MGEPRAVLAEGAAPVVDPVFGRDIGFFLFELPFLRLVQSLFNAIVIVTLVAVGIHGLPPHAGTSS